MANPYNFKDAKDAPAVRFINTGIHELTVLDVYYQPIGDSVRNERKKELTKGENDGPLVSFTKEQTRIVLQVEKTIAGNESRGAITVISLYEPFNVDPKKFEGQINRIFHILRAMAPAVAQERVETYIKGFPGSTTAEFAEYIKRGFAPREGAANKKLRLKFIADQDGKFPQIPSYYSGFAECVDVPTVMKYNEEKEGLAKKSGVELAEDDRPSTFASNTATTLAPSNAPVAMSVAASPITTPAATVVAPSGEVNIFAQAGADDLPF